jgi:YD repeat-containing protein
MNKLIIAAIVGTSLTFGAVAQAKEHEEENIDSSKVPAAVQQAAEKEAAGGRIVRWEKEGKAYEAVIEKDGKQWGYRFDANGNMKGKHDENTEKGEKNEH